MKNFLAKTKTWFVDHYHILFKSAADNHLRIQNILKNSDGTYQLTVNFASYTELKNYQRKLRRASVGLSTAVAMIVVALVVGPYIFNPSKSSANMYSWTQTDWSGSANSSSLTLGTSSGWGNYFQTGTDAAGLNFAAPGQVGLQALSATKTQTDNGTSATGFNAAGSANAQTVVSPTGTAGADGDVELGVSLNINSNFGDNVRAVAPKFNQPSGVALDAANNKLYVIRSSSNAGGGYMIAKFDSGSGGTTRGAGYETFGSLGSGTNQFNLPTGLAIDGTNNKLYVADAGNHRIVMVDSGGGGTTLGANWQSFGSVGVGTNQFSQNYGIAVDAQNRKLYVTDYAEAGYARIVRFDSGTGGTTLGANWQSFGTMGRGANQFITPMAITFESATNKIYVLDGTGCEASDEMGCYSTIANNRIARFDSGSGGTTFGANWQVSGSTLSSVMSGGYYAPGLAIDSIDNKIYISDNTNNKISRLDSGSGGTTLGANMSSFGSSGTGASQFAAPAGIAVDGASNKVFVTEQTNNRFVQIDSGSGGTTFGANWHALGFLNSLDENNLRSSAAVAVDVVNNRIYTYDVVNGRFLSFDSGGGGTTMGARWQTFGTSGSGTNQFGTTQAGIALDTLNNKIYVGDTANSRIVRFDSGTGGTTLGANWQAFGTRGTGVNQFSVNPLGVAIDSVNNKVYVSDSGDNRVVRFDSGSGGTTLGANWQTFGTSGSGVNQFSNISSGMGVSVDLVNNKVYVADGGNYRIARFDSGSGGTTLGANWQTFGTNGSGANQFSVNTNYVAVDNTANKVYVADRASSPFTGYLDRFDSGSGGTTFGANWERLTGDNFKYQFGEGIALDTANKKVYAVSNYYANIYRFEMGGSILQYYASGNYTSGVVDTGQKNASWGNVSWGQTLNGGTIGILLATSQDNVTWTNFKGTDGTDQTDCGNGKCYTINTGQQINAVHNGARYIKYKVFLTGNTSSTPKLNDITFVYTYYPQTAQKLVSSPFDTSDVFNSVGNIAWTTAAGGSVKFQLRTSADGISWGQWCGPTSCNATLGAADFYTNNVTNTINTTQTDHSNDRWFQYAAFLASTDGTDSAVLQDVTTTYTYNVPPAISALSYTQNSDGTVSVPYTLSETYDGFGKIAHGTAAAPIKSLLFFQPKSDVTAPALTNSQTGIITLANPGSVPIPASGNMLIDNELISFDSAGATGNQRNITARGANFATSFPTTAASHSAGAAVFFQASAPIQTINSFSATGTMGTDATVNNTFIWDPRTDATNNLNGSKIATMLFKVVANDADSLNLNTIGQSSATAEKTLDLQAPMLQKISAPISQTTYYNAIAGNNTINIDFQFSTTDDTISASGVKFKLNSGGATQYDCAPTYPTNAYTMRCSYTVGAGVNAADLDVTEITGTIKDAFGNIAVLSPLPTGTNSLGGMKDGSNNDVNVVVDTAAPQVTNVVPATNGFINVANKNISYTLVDANNLATGGTLTFTKIPSGTNVVCTLNDASLTASSGGTTHSIDATNLAASCSNVSGTFANGGTYTMTFAVSDKAANANATSPSTGIIYDQQAPTVSGAKISVTGASGTAGAFKKGDTVTVSWNNTAGGDNNTDIAAVTVDFSQIGGSNNVAATNSNGTWSAAYVLPDNVNYVGKTIGVKAMDNGANTTTTASSAISVDTLVPTISNAKISVTGATGTSGTFKVGDTATIQWDNSGAGDNNADIAALPQGVTFDCSAIGATPSVVTLSGGKYSTTCAVALGRKDTGAVIGVSIKDAAGNQAQANSSPINTDTQAPTLTDGNISISGATGNSGVFKKGDTVTATWNNTGSGDNNNDIATATADFSQIGGSSTVAATNNGGSWTATYVLPDDVTYSGKIIALTVTDNAGNVITTADAASLAIDTVLPALQYFYSTSPNSTVDNPTGSGNINITAVYSKPLAAGSTMQVKVGPMSANAVATLNTISGNSLSGTFTIGAPRTGYDTTPAPLAVENIVANSESVIDAVGNVQSATATTIADGQNLVAHASSIIIDTTPPILQSFTIENGKGSGAFKAGDSFTLVANYNKTIQAGGTVAVTLNTGASAHSITLTNATAGKKLIGTYTVANGENAQDLLVENISAQHALDGKGALLSATGNVTNGEYVTNNGGDGVTNLSGYQADTVSPVISFANDADNVDAGPLRSDDVKIHVVETNPVDYKYVFSSDTDCASKVYDNGGIFTNDQILTFNTEDNNDKYLCIQAADKADNKTYQASANKFNIDVTKPTGTIVLDRSKDNAQIALTAADALRTIDGLKVQTVALTSDATCDFGSASWIDYANAVDLADNTSDYLKVCARFKDVAGNISDAIAAVAPEAPQKLAVVDTSNMSASPAVRRGFISWQVPTQVGLGWKQSELDVCSIAEGSGDCVPTNTLATFSNQSDNYFVHNNLEAGTRYCYRAKFIDTNNDVSVYASTTCFVPGSASNVDTTAPVVGNISGLSGWINNALVSFTLSEPLLNGSIVVTATSAVNGETNGAVHSYVFSGAELATTTSQTKEVLGLIDGNTYKMKFTGKDFSGNDMNFTEVTGIHFDTTAPTVTNVSPAESAVVKTADVKFTLSEILQAGAQIVFTATTANNGEVIGGAHAYVLNGGEAATLSEQTKTVQGLVGGNRYTLKFVGYDLAWNPITFAEIGNISYDNNAPTIKSDLSATEAIISPNGDGSKDNTTFGFEANKDGTYQIIISENGGQVKAELTGSMSANTPKQHIWDGKDGSAIVLPDGNYNATLVITDTASNSTMGNSLSIKIDSAGPQGTFAVNNNAAMTISPNVTLNMSMTDAVSGIASMSFSNDGNTWSAPEGYADTKSWTLPDGDGDKTVYAKFVDNAGNTTEKNDIITLNTNSITIAFVGADGDVDPNVNKADHIAISVTGLNIANAAYGFTDATCDGSADADINVAIAGGATSRTKTFDVTDESHNGKYVCIKADDGSSQPEYKRSANALNIDAQNPVVAFTDDVSGNLVKSEDVVIHAEDANLDTTTYAFTSGVCDGSLAFDNTFISDQPFTIATEHPGKYVCARATDKAGNASYVKSANALNVDATAATGTVSIDRTASTGQVALTLKPSDSSGLNGMKANMQILDSDSLCSMNAATQIDITSSTTIATLPDTNPASSIKKACVQFVDAVGNVSDIISALTPETPVDLKIKDVSNMTAPAYLGAKISWQAPAILGTGGFKNAEIESCSTSSTSDDCVPNKSLAVLADPQQNFYLDDQNLTVAKYCYRMFYRDNAGDISAYSNTACFVPGAITTPDTHGVITNVTIDNITKTEATISFRTLDSADGNSPLPTKALVQAYTDSALTKLAAATPLEAAYSIDHIIKLTVPTSLNPYYLKISATDSSSDTNPNKTVELAYDAVNNPTLMFTTLGILSKINIDLAKQPSVISDTAAAFSFTTDQKANCVLENGTVSGDYKGVPAVETKGAFVINHAIHLEGLLPLTQYFYKLTCAGDDGTTVSSNEGKFTTLEKSATGTGTADTTAPTISNVALPNISGESAMVTWDTNEAANSLVAYELEGTDFMLMAGDFIVNADRNKYTTSHSVSITGLIPASKYLFTVVSSDASGNIGQSVQSNFTTSQPSSLSSIKVVSTALGNATITWTSGNDTTSEVDYGLTAAYGQTKKDSSMTKDHTLILEGLTPGATYHFRVKSEDSLKNVYASSDITFQSQAPPKITDFKVDSISEHGAIITFGTNVPTNALVTYANVDNADDNGAQGKMDMLSNHKLELKNLESGATFSLKVKVSDEAGNVTEENFANFTTTKDMIAPKIDRVKTDSALTQNDKVQSIISWTTDEMATGQVVYKEGKNGQEKTFDVNTAPSFSHVGVITSFKPGTVYYFNVVSTDAAGNVSKSNDYALLTPKQSQNIIQVIIGNFTDIFGWAKFGN